MNLCPKCSAPLTGDTCDVCAHFAAVRQRVTFRQRRHTPRGGRWARAQMERAAHEQPPENAHELPPSDR